MSERFRTPKDPNETIIYKLSFAMALGAGDTITGTPTVTIANANKVSQSNDTNSVSVKVSGGVAGTDALITVAINTTNGEVIERSAVLSILEL